MIRLWVEGAHCADAYGFTADRGVLRFRGRDRREVIGQAPISAIKIPHSKQAEFWYHCAFSSAIPRDVLAQVQHLDRVASRTPGWDSDGRPIVDVEIPVECAQPEWLETPSARRDRLRDEILAALGQKT